MVVSHVEISALLPFLMTRDDEHRYLFIANSLKDTQAMKPSGSQQQFSLPANADADVIVPRDGICLQIMTDPVAFGLDGGRHVIQCCVTSL